jgi:hypothetical protein
MRTDELIADLARRATPVRVLRAPWQRWAAWLPLAAGSALAGLAVFGTRPDLAAMLTRPMFIATAVAAASVTMLAAVAALRLGVPGAEFSTRLRATVVAIAAAWAALLVVAVLQAGHGFSGATEWPICFVRVLGIGALPAAILFQMLRRAAPLEPAWASAMAGMAAMGAAAGAIQAICPLNDPAHALLGHFGPVLAVGALAAWAAPRWLTPRRVR